LERGRPKVALQEFPTELMSIHSVMLHPIGRTEVLMSKVWDRGVVFHDEDNH
jgi:hypothetical protein